MNFMVFGKNEPVEIKMLDAPLWPMSVSVEKVQAMFCRSVGCPACTLIADIKYERTSLSRWADDGGLIPEE